MFSRKTKEVIRMKEAKFLKCFIDGNELAVVRDDFVNLQSDPAVFIRLKKISIKNIQNLMAGELL